MTQSTTLTAEIVTFRAANGVSTDVLLAAARGTDTIVRAAPGFISRQLSCDNDGQWTDYILWQDLASAKSAAETIVKDPAFADFGATIDMATVTMHHADVLWEMPKVA